MMTYDFMCHEDKTIIAMKMRTPKKYFQCEFLMFYFFLALRLSSYELLVVVVYEVFALLSVALTYSLTYCMCVYGVFIIIILTLDYCIFSMPILFSIRMIVGCCCCCYELILLLLFIFTSNFLRSHSSGVI